MNIFMETQQGASWSLVCEPTARFLVSDLLVHVPAYLVSQEASEQRQEELGNTTIKEGSLKAAPREGHPNERCGTSAFVSNNELPGVL